MLQYAVCFRIDALLMMEKVHVCIMKLVLPCPVWHVLVDNSTPNR